MWQPCVRTPSVPGPRVRRPPPGRLLIVWRWPLEVLKLLVECFDCGLGWCSHKSAQSAQCERLNHHLCTRRAPNVKGLASVYDECLMCRPEEGAGAHPQRGLLPEPAGRAGLHGGGPRGVYGHQVPGVLPGRPDLRLRGPGRCQRPHAAQVRALLACLFWPHQWN